MKGSLEKLLSWFPVVALLLFVAVAWQFLHYEGQSEPLLQKACQEEVPTNVTRNPFLLIYRDKGCQSVPASSKQSFLKDLLWWESVSSEFRLPSLRDGTIIDIRPGETLIRSNLGSPGALKVAPSDQINQRYELSRGLNLIILREAFPKMDERTRSLVAESLALYYLGRDSLQAPASSKARDLSENIKQDWPNNLKNCPSPCSPGDLTDRLQQDQ